jgi:hypothetical protein
MVAQISMERVGLNRKTVIAKFAAEAGWACLP